MARSRSAVVSVTEAERGAALEAIYERRRLSQKERSALLRAGISPNEQKRAPVDRPWGSADRTLLWRLAAVRGWSPAAIAAFTHRTETAVAAALRRFGISVRSGCSAPPRRVDWETLRAGSGRR